VIRYRRDVTAVNVTDRDVRSVTAEIPVWLDPVDATDTVPPGNRFMFAADRTSPAM